MVENYLLIDESTNIVDNVVMWDGNTNTWQPPENHIWMPQATTPALIWFWDAAIKDYALEQQMGAASVGFTWNGTECVTNEPKPEPQQAAENQPETDGTQTL